MTVKIDKDIEMPAGGRTHYPWASMEVGDSFAVEKYISTANANKSHYPKRFTCRRLDGRFRVWRQA